MQGGFIQMGHLFQALGLSKAREFINWNIWKGRVLIKFWQLAKNPSALTFKPSTRGEKWIKCRGESLKLPTALDCQATHFYILIYFKTQCKPWKFLGKFNSKVFKRAYIILICYTLHEMKRGPLVLAIYSLVPFFNRRNIKGVPLLSLCSPPPPQKKTKH